MEKEGTKVELAVVGISSLWGIAFALLCLATYTDGLAQSLGKWSLFITAEALLWSVLYALAKSRRRLMQSIRYELQLLREESGQEHRRFEVV